MYVCVCVCLVEEHIIIKADCFEQAIDYFDHKFEFLYLNFHGKFIQLPR